MASPSHRSARPRDTGCGLGVRGGGPGVRGVRRASLLHSTEDSVDVGVTQTVGGLVFLQGCAQLRDGGFLGFGTLSAAASWSPPALWPGHARCGWVCPWASHQLVRETGRDSHPRQGHPRRLCSSCSLATGVPRTSLGNIRWAGVLLTLVLPSSSFLVSKVGGLLPTLLCTHILGETLLRAMYCHMGSVIRAFYSIETSLM